MTPGKRIRQLRTGSGLTQHALGQATGLAVSYLSRLENERVTPTIRTLNRIAEAFRVPLATLLESEPALELTDRCPVSLSGRCILDEFHAGRGRATRRSVETYSSQQLAALRLCNLVLHCKDPRLLQALHVFLESLLALAATNAKRSARQGPPSNPGRQLG